MDRSAIETIQEGAAPVFKDLNGKTFSNKEFYPVMDNSIKKAIEVTNLDSVVRFLDGKGADEFLINIRNYRRADILSQKCDILGKRNRWLIAEPDLPGYELNCFLEMTKAIIALKTKFKQTEQIDTLVKTLGNITSSKVNTVLDDGITQKVEMAEGITLSKSDKMPLFVNLIPYFTFFDVDQPEIPFLIRLREGGQGLPVVGLFPADGGLWKEKCIGKIRDFFAQRIPEITFL